MGAEFPKSCGERGMSNEDRNDEAGSCIMNPPGVADAARNTAYRAL